MPDHQPEQPPFMQRIFDVSKRLSAKAIFHTSVLGTMAYAFHTGSIDSNFFTVYGLGVGINLLSGVIERLALGEQMSDEAILEKIKEALAESDLDKALTEEAFARKMARLFERQEWFITQLITNSETAVLHQMEQYHLLTAVGLQAIYKRLGQVQKGDEHFQAVVLDILKRLSPAPQGPPMQRPEPVENFTDRKTELAQLLTDLQPGEVVRLFGAGGMGKSALAAQALWTLAPGNTPPELFPDGIITHNFYTEPQAEIALQKIAKAFGEEPQPTAKAAAQRVLAGKRLLLLLDGAEDAHNLNTLLEVRDQCGVLITTRPRNGTPSNRQEIKPLPPNDAVDLLQAWAAETAVNDAIGTQICAEVGHLPLAVKLVGRYLSATGEPAADYLKWLQKEPINTLVMDDVESRHDSVERLLVRSVAQIGGDGKQVLSLVSVLALAPFSQEIVAAALPDVATRKPLNRLVMYGLLIRGEDGRFEVGHRLIHTYARRRLAASQEMLLHLADTYTAMSKEQTGAEGFVLLDAERPHIMNLLPHLKAESLWEPIQNLAFAIADYLKMQGYWLERQVVIQSGLAAARAQANERNEAAFLNNLGLVYQDKGEWDRAIEFYQQSLEISEKVGDEVGMAPTYNNLGSVYQDKGEWDRAIEFYQQSLEIREKVGDVIGESITRYNMALILREQGQLTAAVTQLQRVVEIDRLVQHPDLESDMAMLAKVEAELAAQA